MAQTPLQQILVLLKKRHGTLKPPLPGRDPLPFLYLEAAGYLCTDDKRLAAFMALRDRVGLAPKAVLAALMSVLTTICRIGGLFPERRAERLKEIAALVRDDFGGDLTSLLSWDHTTARKALQRFPMIGEPGADRILMLCGYSGAFGFQSNEHRTLNRLGYGEELRNYTKSYRLTRDA
jgi:endonuclease III